MIYVDEPVEYAPTHCKKRSTDGTKWAHLVTDGGAAELNAFAAKISLRKEWLQKDGYVLHYDIPEKKIEEALALGAKPITRLEWYKFLMVGKP